MQRIGCNAEDPQRNAPTGRPQPHLRPHRSAVDVFDRFCNAVGNPFRIALSLVKMARKTTSCNITDSRKLILHILQFLFIRPALQQEHAIIFATKFQNNALKTNDCWLIDFKFFLFRFWMRVVNGSIYLGGKSRLLYWQLIENLLRIYMAYILRKNFRKENARLWGHIKWRHQLHVKDGFLTT